MDASGPGGTVCAQASWEDVPFGLDGYAAPWRRAYRAAMPPFDPQLSGAAPYQGRLAERIRTWPGAVRGAHPVAGVTAVGARAGWLVEPHPLDDGFGTRSPYARLAAAGGAVVLLGAPLRTISLLHHAESIAAVPKRWTRLTLPDPLAVRRGRLGRVARARRLGPAGPLSRRRRTAAGDRGAGRARCRRRTGRAGGGGGGVAVPRGRARRLRRALDRAQLRLAGIRQRARSAARGRCRPARAARDAARRGAAGPAPAGRRTTARDRSRCPVAHGRARPSRPRPLRAR